MTRKKGGPTPEAKKARRKELLAQHTKASAAYLLKRRLIAEYEAKQKAYRERTKDEPCSPSD